MLVCTLLNFVGVAARSIGVAFGQHPRLLLAVLAPMLDRLGDDDAEARRMASRNCASILTLRRFPLLPPRLSCAHRSMAVTVARFGRWCLRSATMSSTPCVASCGIWRRGSPSGTLLCSN